MKIVVEFELLSLPALIEVGQQGDMIAELIRANAFGWAVARGLRATVVRESADLPSCAPLDRAGSVSERVFDATTLETSVGAGLYSVCGGAVAVDRPAGAPGVRLVYDAGRKIEGSPLFGERRRGERGQSDCD
jgi:hypothetical protein